MPIFNFNDYMKQCIKWLVPVVGFLTYGHSNLFQILSNKSNSVAGTMSGNATSSLILCGFMALWISGDSSHRSKVSFTTKHVLVGCSTGVLSGVGHLFFLRLIDIGNDSSLLVPLCNLDAFFSFLICVYLFKEKVNKFKVLSFAVYSSAVALLFYSYFATVSNPSANSLAILYFAMVLIPWTANCILRIYVCRLLGWEVGFLFDMVMLSAFQMCYCILSGDAIAIGNYLYPVLGGLLRGIGRWCTCILSEQDHSWLVLMLMATNSICSTIWAWLLFHEGSHPAKIAGVILQFIAVCLMNIPEKVVLSQPQNVVVPLESGSLAIQNLSNFDAVSISDGDGNQSD